MFSVLAILLITTFCVFCEVMTDAAGNCGISDDAKTILNGVNTLTYVEIIDIRPSKLSVFGDNATVLATMLPPTINGTESESPAVAAAVTANGNKIVVFGYTSFGATNDIDSQTFLWNILNWMKPESGPYKVGILSTDVGISPLYNNAKFKGTKESPDKDLALRLSQYDILVINNIFQFVNYVAPHFIHYLALPNKCIIVGKLKEPVDIINKLIEPHGIYWTNYAMVGAKLRVNQTTLSTTHVSCIVDKLRVDDFNKKSYRLFEEFMNYATKAVATNTCMKTLLEDYSTFRITNDYIPNRDNPVTGDLNGSNKQRFFWEILIGKYVMQYADPVTIRAHPASFYYPSLQFEKWGKSARQQTVSVQPVTPRIFKSKPLNSKKFNPCQKFNTDTKPLVIRPHTTTDFFWYQTGMYARPGEVVTIDFPKVGANISQIKVRIGVNTIDLTKQKDDWFRYPKIDAEKQVDNVNFRIASPFGGLMYIVLPSNYNGTRFLVEFSGSYVAPTYIYGQTTKLKWNQMVIEPEAPWGQIYSRDVVDLVLPIDELQKISNPEEILIEFNKGIEGIKYLADVEMSTMARYIKDYRFDVNFFAFSGYPINFEWAANLRLESAKAFCTVQNAWAFWHELGHNVQYDKMYLSNSAEVTCNLFAVYNIAKYCNATLSDILYSRYPYHFVRWEAGGRKFDDYLSNVDLQLVPWVQLMDKYGFESIRKLHKFYNKMREDGNTGGNVPGDLNQRIDLMYVVYSQIVGEDIAPFLKTWNFPLSETAEQCVQGLSLKKCSLQFCNEFNNTGVMKRMGFKC